MSEARKPAEGVVPLTAARLRELASAPGLVVEFLSITGPEAAMLADALEIADSGARSDIESFCGWENEGGERWYDTDTGDVKEGWREIVELAVRYLDARGVLEKHATRPALVRFQEIPD